MRIFLLALIFAPLSMFSQNTISIHVHNVPSNKGHINVAVYNSDATFLSFDGVFNWLGIPKEKVAFSKGKMKTFGPPKYKECSFRVHSDYEINVEL